MDLIAREVMQRDIQTVIPELTLPELDERFVEAKVTGFPVVEGTRLVGVVSRADVVRQLHVEREMAEQTSDFYFDTAGFHEIPVESIQQIGDRVGERLEQLRVKDVMHRTLFAVGPDQPLRVVAQTLTDNHIHRVLVTEKGELIGLISTLDFVRLYANGRVRAN